MSEFSVIGNNGGDILELKHIKDNQVYLKSGSSCVMSVNAVVPVEFITKAIENLMLENDCDIFKAIDSFGWGKEFKTQLKGQVSKACYDTDILVPNYKDIMYKFYKRQLKVYLKIEYPPLASEHLRSIFNTIDLMERFEFITLEQYEKYTNTLIRINHCKIRKAIKQGFEWE